MRSGVTSLLGIWLALAFSNISLAEDQKQGDKKPSATEQQKKEAIRLPATIIPARHVDVSPRVSGQVVEVLVEEGSQVKAGQVLLRLDHAEYELEYKSSVALVARAQARLAEEEA